MRIDTNRCLPCANALIIFVLNLIVKGKEAESSTCFMASLRECSGMLEEGCLDVSADAAGKRGGMCKLY